MSGAKKVFALYDYAGNEGELSFSAGETIDVDDVSDPTGWWYGHIGAREGFFPSNFVDDLPGGGPPSEPAPSAPNSARKGPSGLGAQLPGMGAELSGLLSKRAEASSQPRAAGGRGAGAPVSRGGGPPPSGGGRGGGPSARPSGPPSGANAVSAGQLTRKNAPATTTPNSSASAGARPVPPSSAQKPASAPSTAAAAAVGGGAANRKVPPPVIRANKPGDSVDGKKGASPPMAAEPSGASKAVSPKTAGGFGAVSPSQTGGSAGGGMLGNARSAASSSAHKRPVGMMSMYVSSSPASARTLSPPSSNSPPNPTSQSPKPVAGKTVSPIPTEKEKEKEKDKDKEKELYRVKAVADYADGGEGELTFSAGDRIAVMDDSDPDGWWRGQLLGQDLSGWFPSTFVERCDEAPEDEADEEEDDASGSGRSGSLGMLDGGSSPSPRLATMRRTSGAKGRKPPSRKQRPDMISMYQGSMSGQTLSAESMGLSRSGASAENLSSIASSSAPLPLSTSAPLPKADAVGRSTPTPVHSTPPSTAASEPLPMPSVRKLDGPPNSSSSNGPLSSSSGSMGGGGGGALVKPSPRPIGQASATPPAPTTLRIAQAPEPSTPASSWPAHLPPMSSVVESIGSLVSKLDGKPGNVRPRVSLCSLAGGQAFYAHSDAGACESEVHALGATVQPFLYACAMADSASATTALFGAKTAVPLRDWAESAAAKKPSNPLSAVGCAALLQHWFDGSDRGALAGRIAASAGRFGPSARPLGTQFEAFLRLEASGEAAAAAAVASAIRQPSPASYATAALVAQAWALQASPAEAAHMVASLAQALAPGLPHEACQAALDAMESCCKPARAALPYVYSQDGWLLLAVRGLAGVAVYSPTLANVQDLNALVSKIAPLIPRN